ncbi:MAG: hypothetical protein DWI02_11980 [Planctomycetota bacterium]|nr:MAG: hypothetical protein DWI02_11980 [Planctomycetota bacterium]
MGRQTGAPLRRLRVPLFGWIAVARLGYLTDPSLGRMMVPLLGRLIVGFWVLEKSLVFECSKSP